MKARKYKLRTSCQYKFSLAEVYKKAYFCYCLFTKTNSKIYSILKMGWGRNIYLKNFKQKVI